MIIFSCFFQAYYSVCVPCDVEYDVILKLETHDDDSEYLIRKYNLTELQAKKNSWILRFWIIFCGKVISNNETHRSLLQCGSTKARERTSSATTTIMFMTTQGCKNTSSLLDDNLISSRVPLTNCSWHVQCTLHIHVSWGTMMIAHPLNFQNPQLRQN